MDKKELSIFYFSAIQDASGGREESKGREVGGSGGRALGHDLREALDPPRGDGRLPTPQPGVRTDGCPGEFRTFCTDYNFQLQKCFQICVSYLAEVEFEFTT